MNVSFSEQQWDELRRLERIRRDRWVWRGEELIRIGNEIKESQDMTWEQVLQLGRLTGCTANHIIIYLLFFLLFKYLLFGV